MNGIYHLRVFYFSVLIIFLFSCDGRMVFKGYTYRTYDFSGSVSDSLSTEQNATHPLEGVEVKCLISLEEIRITAGMRPEIVLTSDHNGYFEGSLIIPPRKKMWGALIAEKSGFYSDTVYFKFQSSPNPYQFNINLRAID